MPVGTKDLVLDVGNTRIKWALFGAEGPLDHGSIAHVGAGLPGTLPLTGLTAIVLGSTADPDPSFIATLRSAAPVLEVTGGSEAPIRSRYGTPLTLGADRLANAVAAAQRFPDRPSLTIDLGTCVTYDLCEAGGTYLGGAIAPGLRMRAMAMNAYSAKLPLVDPPDPPVLLGATTGECLGSGVHHGLLGELEGFIRRFGQGRPGMVVLLTGGDAPRMARALESGIFALPLLTLEGYHALLTHHRRIHGGVMPAGARTGGGPGTTG